MAAAMREGRCGEGNFVVRLNAGSLRIEFLALLRSDLPTSLVADYRFAGEFTVGDDSVSSFAAAAAPTRSLWQSLGIVFGTSPGGDCVSLVGRRSSIQKREFCGSHSEKADYYFLEHYVGEELWRQHQSREDHRKQLELEEARKAGLAPAELDEDGKEINPHIPQYMSSAPWYLNAERPSLKHQRKWKSDPNYTKDWYDRGAKVYQAEKFRPGACTNCGAMSHDIKTCMERPRKVGAKWTNKRIAADEKVESFELDYDGKRDRWNGYDPATYARVIDSYEMRDEARRKYQKEQQMKKMEQKNAVPARERGTGDDSDEDDEDEDDDAEVDEAKVDESKQMDFAKVEKRVRTTGGGSTGTVRNLRIREDTAKYLLNLDVNSAYYDPKTRSMREDPLPETDPNEKFYAIKKEKLKSQTKEDILSKYGNAAEEEKPDMELLLGQTERQVEYDRAGRIIKGQEKAVPKSKYEEDVYINNHTTVWGSWWKDGLWGFKCCKQHTRNSYCTGQAGIDAAEASADLMRSNIEKKEALSEKPAAREEKNPATWGSEVPDDLVLDHKKLKAALKKEDDRQREEKDERKRKYNVTHSDEVTAEDMEAYRMKKVHFDDPMKDFL
ncbi:hypothetical protein AXG93_154s1060 [Marchantia polymorpha subsp. ruderalis]|uniref:Pre-mRNA-splicing factor SLU7 n=1 Tax=Marchantia polymorpha subsp. ruderalis TaxID=1480154 RepID=A0A176VJV7_MARPO|nr:hypothetical protein AXG93_154s1060 [Marchantia polymorpha subsp. ruderalis]